jgi:hypothetical protein
MVNNGHCGAEACDCGRRTFIPVWVRQDTTIRMANHGHCGAAAANILSQDISANVY